MARTPGHVTVPTTRPLSPASVRGSVSVTKGLAHARDASTPRPRLKEMWCRDAAWPRLIGDETGLIPGRRAFVRDASGFRVATCGVLVAQEACDVKLSAPWFGKHGS